MNYESKFNNFVLKKREKMHEDAAEYPQLIAVILHKPQRIYQNNLDECVLLDLAIPISSIRNGGFW